MCVFHTDVSMLAQAIFLAVHIHGVDCFGVEPLFYDTERRARHPSDFGKHIISMALGESMNWQESYSLIDWILKEHSHEKRPYDSYIPNEELNADGLTKRGLTTSGAIIDNMDDSTSSNDDESEALIRVAELAWKGGLFYARFNL